MPDSQAQVRLAHAVASGGARDSKMSKKAAREIISKMHGRKMKSLPKRVKKRGKKRKASRS